MSFLSLRFATAPLLAAFGLASGLACTLILDPDDAVERCGSIDDCPPTGDNRYVAECRFDPDSPLDSTEVDKVCVASFKTIPCDPAAYPNENNPQEMSAYQIAVADAASREHLIPCAETPGARGCPPETGMGAEGCAQGLTLTDAQRPVCDVADDPDVPAYGRGFIPETAQDGQDALDQFCRSFFCDEQWVCDTSDFTCVRCGSDRPYGQGGCGEIYSEGQRSCFYPANLGDVCAGPEAVQNQPVFGNCGE